MTAPVSHPHKDPSELTTLNARMLRMIALMVYGNERDPSRTPYGLYDAAHAVGYHRRAARWLASAPVFVEAYERECAGRGNAGVAPTLDDVRREMEARRRRKRARASPEAIAAAAESANVSPGYWICPASRTNENS